jgi:hypothetical protein
MVLGSRTRKIVNFAAMCMGWSPSQFHSDLQLMGKLFGALKVMNIYESMGIM